MSQQRFPVRPRKNMKKLLAELASRQLNWREEKTKEIINSQRSGLNTTSSQRADLSNNHKELPVVKSANQSAKYIQIKSQNRSHLHLLNASNFARNGNTQNAKRSITELNQNKQNCLLENKTIRNDIESARYEKELVFPKISLELIKKRSSECEKGGAARQKLFNLERLEIIEQQQQGTVKKEMTRNIRKTFQRGIQ